MKNIGRYIHCTAVGYAVQIVKHIYVLHAFQKKSKSGIATPKSDVDLIRKRYKEAQEYAKND